MRRRQFITLLGGMAAWPLPLGAQSAPMPVIGFLNRFTREQWAAPLAGFHMGLAEAGFVEGRNIVVEYRWAEGQVDRIPALAAELARWPVAVLVATGGSVQAVAATMATAPTLPVVFVAGSDPLAQGFVKSFNRPGGNITGVYFLTSELEPKRFGLLRDVVPNAPLIAVLLNPKLSVYALVLKDIEAAAHSVGQKIHIHLASNEAEIEQAFATMAQVRPAALQITADPFFRTRIDRIIELAARHAIPTMYEARDFTLAGGLVSYGTSIVDATRKAGVYTGRILKGEKPADLPVEQSARFEFVVNLKTAKALGLTIPQAILLRADELIE